MADIVYHFYIDESGDFLENDPRNPKPHLNPSLVGGYLCDPRLLTKELIDRLLPKPVHACEKYEKRFLDVLEELRSLGFRFILFENRERLHVINEDTTYLNVLCEGLTQLLHNLKLEHPEDHVTVHVIIANREDRVLKNGTIIFGKEYLTRLKEKLLLSAYRSGAELCDYTLQYRSGRTYKPLYFADIICNTYITRTGKDKFTNADRARINAIYDKQDILSVFENATVGHLKRLWKAQRYAEMMFEICTLPRLTSISSLHKKLLDVIERSAAAERNSYFDYLSLRIGQYSIRRMFAEGIQLAENYKKFFLEPLMQRPSLAQNIAFRMFDTDFHILTMYDHIGNVSKCVEYLARCEANVGSINHSWEHIDYYFSYRIRELNCLIGYFDFATVLERSAGLIKILENAKKLFHMIGANDATTADLRSELLGKVYGVRLQACTNLVRTQPDALSLGLEASDLAMREFVRPGDLARQYQYRCSLMVAAEKPQEALACLLKSYGMDETPDAFTSFVRQACTGRTTPDSFSLWHYTQVMIAFAHAGDARAAEMHKALASFPAFVKELQNPENNAYPWNLIYWNLSRWHRLIGQTLPAQRYYDQALAITSARTEQVVIRSFALSITADRLLHDLKKKRITPVQADKEMRRAHAEFVKLKPTQAMLAAFSLPEGRITEATLKALSLAYLR